MLSRELEVALGLALQEARSRRHEYLCVEHVLYALTLDRRGAEIIESCGGNVKALRGALETFFNRSLEAAPEGARVSLQQTEALERMMQRAFLHVQFSGKKSVDAGDILAAILEEDDLHAAHFLRRQGITRLDVLDHISHGVVKERGGDGGPLVPGGAQFGAAPPAANDPGDGLDDLEEEDDEEDEEEDGGERGKPAPSALDTFTVSLSRKAAEGKLDPLIGRDREIRRALRVLCRRRKNNPVFVGEPGTGKTAMAEGLALRLYEAALGRCRVHVPEELRNAEILSLDVAGMLAGTKFRGDFEQRVKAVVREAARRPGVILFIDEIHTLVGAGATSESTMDASAILKPALASGELRCIGATTHGDFKNHFEKDHALARRFQKIDINEPTVGETVQILKGLQSRYEEHHGIRYTESALTAAAELSARHLNDRFLPDKAIDLLDEAGAGARTDGPARRKTIRPRDIEQVVSELAQIPARSVSGTDKERLGTLETELTASVFGQDEAIAQVVRAVKRARAGLGRPDKPIGSFLFTGPTGVGKTEVARRLAEVLGNHFARYDMSEYMEKHAVSRLIGAPPGYIGFDQGGLLVDEIRRHPYTVLLLDEIEKAHPDLFGILLQVMDNAALTDNAGRKADFRNVILIMTSNAGAREMAASSIGFNAGPGDAAGKGMKAIEKALTPEFRNRLDGIMTFNPLPMPVVMMVVDKFIRQLNRQLAERRVTLALSDEVRRWIAETGYDPKFGARPLARKIEQEIETPLADEILFGKLERGGVVTVLLKDGKPVFEAVSA
ncbi:MAG: ATP-dependent Clp protease ATP-binding subunit ClpA [Candidatus Hydrogenedentes bacterium]|nr:ATP-dependent Clp protease ATP-binding subunit ClpA [Candidatus Hydrogenedentota bacterium]